MISFPVFPSRWRALRAGLGVALSAGLVAGLAAADWQSLTGNSPFGQAPSTAAAQPAGELEFRGVVREDDVTLVNIFNTSTQKSQWIPVQGQAGGISADSYDAASDKLQVTMGGKILTLALKQSRVALVQSAPPPPVGAPPPNTGPNGSPGGNATVVQGGQQPAPGSPDAQQAFRNLPPEARNMIEEIRRRRALRAQSANPTPAPAPNAPAAAQKTSQP